ncbi:DNA replication protein [Aggregatibacter actinomycetemcomitans serotype e str. SC936]|uniref:hypothetical protein n=1 Tax=Aggregatibacter actinomycetemcomitans TaxID=714 RepID=UPI0007972458|nr:hypothetical protein [Aggregatibacter actinomycetemcomitans]KYK80872.1 DNA replication protein [Aggregatibacter actinomycetemcomitans serotype e str. SC936]
MRFSTYINSAKCLEWGLNANQGALFDLLNQSSSWAKEVVCDGEVFYWVSRNSVIDELPLFYSKSDTVYRHFKDLAQKGLIIYKNIEKKDLIRLTQKGKSWNEFNQVEIRKNSEIDPTLGNESEKTRIEIRKNSEIDPTDNNTNYKNTNNHNTSTSGKNFPPAKTGKKFVYTNDDLLAANWIFGLIKNLSPNVKTPNFASWVFTKRRRVCGVVQ